MTDICRLCASLKTLDHLMLINDPDLSLKIKLMRCCQLELPGGDDDLLPQNVCDNCVQRLNKSWQFANDVTDAQETLRKAFANIKEEYRRIDAIGRGIKKSRDLTTAIDNNTAKRKNAEHTVKLQSAIISLHLKNCTVNEIAERLQVESDTVESRIKIYKSRQKLRHNSNTNRKQQISCGNGEYVDHQTQSIFPAKHAADEYHDQRNGDSLNQNTTSEVDDEPQSIEISTEYVDHEYDLNSIDDNSSGSAQYRSVMGEPSTSENENVTDLIAADQIKCEPNHLLKESWTDVPWNCWECNKQFANTLNIRRHFNRQHDGVQLRFSCTECNRMFSRYNPFIKHVRILHRNHLEFCCDICCEFQSDHNALIEHMSTHIEHQEHSYLCQTCGKGFQKSSRLNAHIKSHMPDNEKVHFSCEICQKTCSTKANLSSHMRIHSGIRAFTCDQCGRSFVQKGNLDAHILTHFNNKPFVCALCNKSFKTAARLATHKKVHSNHRPHKCKICCKDFREKNTLNEHMRTHTGEMPYHCEFCGKRFRFKGVLTTHRRVHTGERPYSCVDCNHHFTNWPNYNKHMIRRHGINTSVTVRKPQAIPPSGMPADAKQNYVVPGVVNNAVKESIMTAGATTVTTMATDAHENKNDANFEIITMDEKESQQASSQRAIAASEQVAIADHVMAQMDIQYAAYIPLNIGEDEYHLQYS